METDGGLYLTALKRRNDGSRKATGRAYSYVEIQRKAHVWEESDQEQKKLRKMEADMEAVEGKNRILLQTPCGCICSLYEYNNLKIFLLLTSN